MIKSFVLPRCIIVLMMLLLLSAANPLLFANSGQRAGTSQAELWRHYGDIPLCFEPNQGQLSGDVQFLSRVPGFTVLLRDQEVEFMASGEQSGSNPSIVRMQFIASRLVEKPIALDRQQGVTNYLKGNSPSAWLTQIPNFSRVAYMGVYPGVDVFFYGDHRQIEHDFVISPGADYRQIRVRLDGAQRLVLRADGSLALATSAGDLIFKAPQIYQYKNDRKVAIAGRYSLRAPDEFGFELGKYDRTRPLVIDPVLAYSTYLAGSSVDVGTAIAVDQAGSAYVTGYTFSPDFPVQNPEQGSCSNSCSAPDVFVTKFNPTGSALIYSTYVGGSSYDQGSSIAVDSQGNALVVGSTSSYDFPQKNGLPVVLSTDTHGFAFSLNAAGSAFNFSTYLGGIGSDLATGVAADSAGNVYVSGYTSSVNFPVSPGNQIGPPPANVTNDVFLTKIAPSGGLLSSTLIGGLTSNWPGTFAYTTFPVSVVVNPQGQASLAGNALDGFPTTAGSFQPNYPGSGSTAGFVALLNASGSAFLSATYLGGTGGDNSSGVAINALGNVYITGSTSSSDFPTTPGAFQTTKLGSGQAAFVSEMDSTLSKLIYSSYVGATQSDYENATATSIALDAQGNTYIAGYTNAPSFPLVNALLGTLPQSIYGNANAAFLSVLDPSGSALTFSTFLSGSVTASGAGVALDSSANPYITGYTSDPDFPTTASSFQPAIPTSPYPVQHAFVTEFGVNTPSAGACLSTNIMYFGTVEPGKSSFPIPVTLTNCGSLTLHVNSVTVSNPVFVIAENTCKSLSAGQSCLVKVRYTPPVADGTDSGKLIFSDNAPITPQTVSLQGYSALPYLTLYGNAFNFGDQIVGVTSPPIFVQAWNQGFLPIHISSVSATANFAAINKCPLVLQPGNYCEIGATFTPSVGGVTNGTLYINDDAYGSPQTISLQGNGLATYPTPTISFMEPSSAKSGSKPVQVWIYGNEFFVTSTVTVNGITFPAKTLFQDALQITLPSYLLKKVGNLSIQVVNPAPGGASAPAGFAIYNQTTVGAADMIYEPFTQKIYASIPASSPTNPNSLVTVDPVTGTVGVPISIGNDPGALGLSSDGTTLYVGLNGDNSVVPFDLQTQTAGTEIPLGSDPQKGAFTAADLQVQPGHPTTLVATVKAGYNGVDGIELIQNGKVVSDFLNEPPNNIALGGTHFVGTGDLYGWNVIWNAWGLDQFVIEGNKLYEATGINGEYGMGAFDTNGTYLFDVDGQVFKAADGTLVGTISGINNYSPESGVLTDLSSGRTFFLDQSGTMLAVDSKTLRILGSTSIPANSPPNRLLHWGPDGVAFPTLNSATNTYDLIISRSSLFFPSTAQNPLPVAVSTSPSTVASKGPNFVLTVQGSKFVRGAVVNWNGARRTTTWVSSTKLLADIPSTDIGKPGTAQITVVNPAPGGGQSGGVKITIP
jgi:Beta-propeller repeat